MEHEEGMLLAFFCDLTLVIQLNISSNQFSI